jgi:invasion protein IalB
MCFKRRADRGRLPAARHAEETSMPASRRAASTRIIAAITGALTILAGTAAAGPAPAQAPEGPPAAWRVECTGDGKSLDCRAVQQLFHRESRQLLVSLAVRPAADGKTGAMVMQLPLGLNLTEPITLKIDNGLSERQPIQTCTNVGCFIAMTVADKLLAAMRTGSQLNITVQDSSKKPVEMALPLLGFGVAFDKAK